MAIVITNGTNYIAFGQNRECIKTEDVNSAVQFEDVDSAVKFAKYAPKKTKNYYVYDTETKKILWRWLSEAYRQKYLKNINNTADSKQKKIKRKQYSTDARQLLYDKYDGVCQLCGKKLNYDEMTLDHIIPLGVGGLDDVSNLQIACRQCNFIKADSLPEDFADRITTIFMYQMEKKRKGNFMWEVVATILKKII